MHITGFLDIFFRILKDVNLPKWMNILLVETIEQAKQFGDDIPLFPITGPGTFRLTSITITVFQLAIFGNPEQL